MTSQITSDMSFQPAVLGPAAPRRVQHNPSLPLGRARRALRRQIWLFAAVALFIVGAGVAFDFQGGLRPLAAALFWAPIGLGLGLIAATLRELSRNTVTLISSLAKHRDYDVLGVTPQLTERTLRELAPDKRSPLGVATFQPASPFASSYRDLQDALRRYKLVSFIGPLAGEGATTTAIGAAVSAVQQGKRCIVVDCDTRTRSLTKALGVAADKGVVECCEEPHNWRAYIQEEAETGLHVLPAARMRNVWRGLVGAPGFRALLTALCEEYELVLLDCPPALRSGEGPVLASIAETCVTVAAWDATPLSAVARTARMVRTGGKSAVYINRVLPGFRYARQA